MSWAALAAVMIPLVTLFGAVLITDRSLAMRDAAHFYYPLFEWCCGEWAAGRVPLWNLYENCGVPVLADATSSVFYPGKLVFLLPVSFALRYKLYVIGHVVLAALSSFVTARAWKASPSAAAVAAIAYAFGGGVVFQYCNVVFLVGAAWLPLAALAIERMLRGRSWRAAVGLGVVLSLMILGGDPQMAYHALLIAGMYALVLALARDDQTEGLPQWLVRALLVRVGLIGAAAGLGFLLAAVQILPSSEATKLSERAAFNRPRNIYEAAAVARQPAGTLQPRNETRAQSIARGFFFKSEPGSHHDLAYDFSIGPWRLAEYFWPNIGGRMFPTHRRWFSLLPAEGRTWTPTLYLGLIPVILGLACFRLFRGDNRERWLSWLMLIFTLASFGFYGLGWLAIEIHGAFAKEGSQLAVAPPVGGVYWFFVTCLPTYVYFRYPAKLLPLVSLGLSQLAAIGWDRAVSQRRAGIYRVLLWLGGASGVAAFVMWCVGPALFAKVSRGDSSLGPFDAQGAYYDILLALVQTAAVALTGRWLLRKAWDTPPEAGKWQTRLLMLTAAEVAVANAWLVVAAPADLWRNDSPVAAAVKSLTDESDAGGADVPPRVFRANLAGWRPPSFRQKSSPNRMAEVAQWEHDTLFPKYHLPSELSLVESYGSIKLMDYESLLYVAKQYGPRQPDKTLLPQPTALRLLGTTALVLPEKYQAEEFAEMTHRSPHAPREDSMSRSEISTVNWPESAAVWRMKRTLPRSWIVREIETLPPLPFPLRIEAADVRSMEVLFPGKKPRDFGRVAVVETEEPLASWSTSVAGNNDEASDKSAITHYDPQRVVIEATLARPGLLVLSDAWYPRWKAYISANGATAEATIYRTNRVLRGVWLEAGKQTVEFRFEPASFVRGVWISGASWMVVAIVSAALLWRQSRVHKSSAMHQ